MSSSMVFPVSTQEAEFPHISQHSCCRVYSRTAAGEGHKLLEHKERECVAAAASVICLSCSDADHIRSYLMPDAAAQQPKVSIKGT
jgi:hypothetical protein